MLTHSLKKTPSLKSGPIKLTVSMFAAVACAGFHSGNFVMSVAIGLIATSASIPPITPLQPASAPPSPSGRKRDS